MPAVIRRLRFADGSIRLGPECFEWGDPYTRCLAFEVERVNVAVIGGLNWPPTAEEYFWVEQAMIEEGLRMGMRRYKAGRSYLVLMAMPHWPRCVAGCTRPAILPPDQSPILERGRNGNRSLSPVQDTYSEPGARAKA